MSYSIKYTHQITFTIKGKTFEKRFTTLSPKPSDAILNRIDGDIVEIVSFGHW